MSSVRLLFVDIARGLIPCFIVRIVCARGVINVRIDLDSISWNPTPPRPVGVVAMSHACCGNVD